jgi:hypothetical protein
MAKAKKASALKDTSCGVCGRPLELWDAVRSLDGRTVCAANCLGAGIVIARGKPEFQAEEDDQAARLAMPEEPPELPESAYFDPADCGGTFDGFNVSSDADPGL